MPYFSKVYFIIFFLFCCKKKENFDYNNSIENEIEIVSIEQKNHDLNYLNNPAENDTMCINAIQRAKIDLEKYNGVITNTICFGCINQPYINEIKEIAKEKKIKFYIEDLGCIIYKNQTDGCYSGYVNFFMKKKYGENYYQEIIEKAKSNFINNVVNKDSIVDFYDLNYEDMPKYKNKEITLLDNGIMPVIHTTLPLDFDPNKSMYLNIKFIIEKDGHISNIKLDEWVNEYPNNEKYKDDLYKIAKKELQNKYIEWIPGKYLGNNVRTEKKLQVYFK